MVKGRPSEAEPTPVGLTTRSGFHDSAEETPTRDAPTNETETTGAAAGEKGRRGRRPPPREEAAARATRAMGTEATEETKATRAGTEEDTKAAGAENEDVAVVETTRRATRAKRPRGASGRRIVLRGKSQQHCGRQRQDKCEGVGDLQVCLLRLRPSQAERKGGRRRGLEKT
jgi:hypothetical protein